MIFDKKRSFDVSEYYNLIALAILHDMTDLAHHMLDKGTSAVTEKSFTVANEPKYNEKNNALYAILKNGSQDFQLIEKTLNQPNVNVNDIGHDSALLLALTQDPPNLRLMACRGVRSVVASDLRLIHFCIVLRSDTCFDTCFVCAKITAEDKSQFKKCIKNSYTFERAIVIKCDKAIIGRPPERALAILQ